MLGIHLVHCGLDSYDGIPIICRHIFLCQPGNILGKALDRLHEDGYFSLVARLIHSLDGICRFHIAGQRQQVVFQGSRRIVQRDGRKIRIRYRGFLGGVIGGVVFHPLDFRRCQVEGHALCAEKRHIACVIRNLDIVDEFFSVLRCFLEFVSIFRPIVLPFQRFLR